MPAACAASTRSSPSAAKSPVSSRCLRCARSLRTSFSVSLSRRRDHLRTVSQARGGGWLRTPRRARLRRLLEHRRPAAAPSRSDTRRAPTSLLLLSEPECRRPHHGRIPRIACRATRHRRSRERASADGESPWCPPVRSTRGRGARRRSPRCTSTFAHTSPERLRIGVFGIGRLLAERRELLCLVVAALSAQRLTEDAGDVEPIRAHRSRRACRSPTSALALPRVRRLRATRPNRRTGRGPTNHTVNATSSRSARACAMSVRASPTWPSWPRTPPGP